MIQQKVLFTPNEVARILQYAKDFKQGDGRIVETNRSNYISTVDVDGELKGLLLEKLQKFFLKDLPKTAQILRYETGQRFSRHRDKNAMDEFADRYKTIIVQLSDQNDYEGGTTKVYLGDDVIDCDKEIGNTIIFNSEYLHEATEVIRGTRYSLVLWATYENYGYTRHLL